MARLLLDNDLAKITPRTFYYDLPRDDKEKATLIHAVLGTLSIPLNGKELSAVQSTFEMKLAHVVTGGGDVSLLCRCFVPYIVGNAAKRSHNLNA